MEKFLVIMFSEPWSKEPSREEMDAMMKAWNDWYAQVRRTDSLADPGAPLRDEGKLISPSGVSDGTVKSGKMFVGGYFVLQAESLEKATELTKGCPSVVDGVVLEVRQIVNMSVA